MAKDTVNLQFRVRKAFQDEFNEAFNQSEASNKAEFLRNLLSEYLDPDLNGAEDKIVKPLQEKIEELEQVIDSKDNELIELNDSLLGKSEAKDSIERKYLFFQSTLSPLLKEHKGTKVKLKDPQTKKDISIEIQSIEDVFNVIMKSFKYSKS